MNQYRRNIEAGACLRGSALTDFSTSGFPARPFDYARRPKPKPPTSSAPRGQSINHRMSDFCHETIAHNANARQKQSPCHRATLATKLCDNCASHLAERTTWPSYSPPQNLDHHPILSCRIPSHLDFLLFQSNPIRTSSISVSYTHLTLPTKRIV